MGCDGGTIPKRSELVKEKKKKEQKDKDSELVFRWFLCALSQLQLRMPIVACDLGRLYSKESILEFLLDRSKFESADTFSHIKSLKDVHTLKLTPKSEGPDDNSSSACHFICPISRCEMNGKHKFLFLTGCGCVFSEKVWKELLPSKALEPNSEEIVTCPACSKPCDPSLDVVLLNPESGSELEEAKEKMELRKSKQKLKKKEKKDKDSSSKRPLPDSKPKTTVVEKKSKILEAASAALLQNSSEKASEKSAVYKSLFLPSSSKVR